jgi:hypothetical protein
MTEKSRTDNGVSRANWILFAVLAGVAAALYAFVLINPPTFSH